MCMHVPWYALCVHMFNGTAFHFHDLLKNATRGLQFLESMTDLTHAGRIYGKIVSPTTTAIPICFTDNLRYSGLVN